MTEFERFKKGGCPVCQSKGDQPAIIFNENHAWCATCSTKVYDVARMLKRIESLESRLEALTDHMQMTRPSSLPDSLLKYEAGLDSMDIPR